MNIDGVNLLFQGLKWGLLVGLGSGLVGLVGRFCFHIFDVLVN